MFTGIVEHLVIVKKITEHEKIKQFTIELPEAILQKIKVDDSIAINGVCLTVTNILSNACTVDVTPETLRLTNLNQLKPGDEVNFETSLTLQKSMGGHFVQGHVDTMAEITEIKPEGASARVTFKLDKDFLKYLVYKAFITIDGMSLTVTDVQEETFSVALIPHTLQKTRAHSYEVGVKVNIEVDMMAKQVHHYLENYK